MGVSIGELGAGQERYYIEKVAGGAEDYSGEGCRLGAMQLGLNPATGDPLGLKSAPGREPVPGFDLTISAPKSVSLTWALGGQFVHGKGFLTAASPHRNSRAAIPSSTPIS
jgi:hypothetical protein